MNLHFFLLALHHHVSVHSVGKILMNASVSIHADKFDASS